MRGIACYGLSDGAAKGNHCQPPVLKLLGLEKGQLLPKVDRKVQSEVAGGVQSQQLEVEAQLRDAPELQAAAKQEKAPHGSLAVSTQERVVC
eukprot:CAMPEP_0181458692 /NCGR_PEP_ID=MMETSP1110-20121109/32440_1 /TAXON_ID=174948 /ORGANISM="Symbiodinium sp., Strain CCMP421" /LENGTH=91 /DNA_ID=CAMNT_0023583187 /DNA_START=66 /DNA_END=341 /DNA_ORIENTATION=-